MGKLTDLAAQISDADRRAGEALNASILKADGLELPKFLNVRLTRTPEQLAANAEGVKRQLEDFRNRRVSSPAIKEPSVAKPTPKADQLRALREASATGKPAAKPAERREKAAAAIEKTQTSTQANPAEPKADTKESAMRKTATTTKSKARNAVKGKSKAEGVRPGSKLETIVKLLQRAKGCTTKDVLEATGWPAVSMPQQAKAAGLKLIKEKDGAVTRYRAG